jgi:hypothetical protein
MPADLKHAVSETTLRVLEGGNVTMTADFDEFSKKMRKSEIPDPAKPYQRIIQRPIVKKDAVAEAQRRYEKPTLDISLTHVSLLSYCPRKIDNGENIVFLSPFLLSIVITRSLSIAI